MLTWFENNLGTICVTIVLAAIVSVIIAKMIRDKKRGKSACGCGCSHCAMAGKCGSGINARQTKLSGSSIVGYFAKIH